MALRKKLKLDNDSQDSGFDQNAQSKYFKSNETDLSEKFLQIELDLVSKINTISFHKPIDYVYSPIEYAFETHSNFIKTYCKTTKKLLFLGINPGPWGMSQNGVCYFYLN